MREKSYKTALGGVLSAAALSIMLLGSILPFSTYLAPSLASLCVLILFAELGTGAALTMYAAVSILGVLLCADKEAALIFAFFLGFYPVLKSAIDRIRKKGVRVAIKLACFNTALLLLYFLLIKIFTVSSVIDDFSGFTTFMYIAFVIAGNATFLMFDVVLTKSAFLYWAKIRPRLCKK